ncbi:hypothetical protein O9992_12205 [Vibrio lentus]|nr:hypothetical protein [Vibrio lentus]
MSNKLPATKCAASSGVTIGVDFMVGRPELADVYQHRRSNVERRHELLAVAVENALNDFKRMQSGTEQ